MQVEILRSMVRSLYDAQKLRIEMGNRVAAHTRDGVLDDDWGLRLTNRHQEMQTIEKGLLKDVGDFLRHYPISEWLFAVKGIGPAMAGVLVSEIGSTPRRPKGLPDSAPWEPAEGIARFDTVSKLWAWSGLHVVDGRAPRRRRGEKANWNGFLRAKLIGVMGPCFLKSSSDYRSFYDNYKLRILNRPCSLSDHGKGAAKKLPEINCTEGHVHNRAMRYMVKMFILDLWKRWREMESLPIREPYAEEYLQKTHL